MKSKKDIALQLGITPQHFYDVIKTRSRPSWDLASALARLTNTKPDLWIEGTTQEKVLAVTRYQTQTEEAHPHEANQDPQ